MTVKKIKISKVSIEEILIKKIINLIKLQLQIKQKIPQKIKKIIRNNYLNRKKIILT